MLDWLSTFDKFITPAPTRTSCGHPQKLIQPHATLRARQQALSICDWNSLPLWIIQAPSLNSLKSWLNLHWAHIMHQIPIHEGVTILSLELDENRTYYRQLPFKIPGYGLKVPYPTLPYISITLWGERSVGSNLIDLCWICHCCSQGIILRVPQSFS